MDFVSQVAALFNVSANKHMEMRKNPHTRTFLNGLKPLGLCYREQEWSAKALSPTKVWTLSYNFWKL